MLYKQALPLNAHISVNQTELTGQIVLAFHKQ